MVAMVSLPATTVARLPEAELEAAALLAAEEATLEEAPPQAVRARAAAETAAAARKLRREIFHIQTLLYALYNLTTAGRMRIIDVPVNALSIV